MSPQLTVIVAGPPKSGKTRLLEVIQKALEVGSWETDLVEIQREDRRVCAGCGRPHQDPRFNMMERDLFYENLDLMKELGEAKRELAALKTVTP